MLKERLESIKNLLASYNRYDATREILDLADDYDLEDYVENIIEESMINEIIQDRLRCCGWQNIACMLDKVNYLDDDYYFMNGYGNLEELTISHLECIFSDMVEALNRIEE